MCAWVIQPTLRAARRHGVAMVLPLYFIMAYQGSYGSTELIQEVINEEFNSQQWLGCKQSNIPDEEMIPILTGLIWNLGGAQQQHKCAPYLEERSSSGYTTTTMWDVSSFDPMLCLEGKTFWGMLRQHCFLCNDIVPISRTWTATRASYCLAHYSF